MSDQADGGVGRKPVDSEQIAEMYLSHAERLRKFLWGLLKDSEAVGEALQSTFRIALESIGEVPSEKRKAWLYRVAYNEAMGIRRKAGFVRRRQAMAARAVADANAGPPELSMRWEDVRRVREAIGKLPDAQAEVVRLRLYEGLTFQQIADQHQCPLGTVLTRMRAAMEKLRIALGADGES